MLINYDFKYQCTKCSNYKTMLEIGISIKRNIYVLPTGDSLRTNVHTLKEQRLKSYFMKMEMKRKEACGNTHIRQIRTGNKVYNKDK